MGLDFLSGLLGGGGGLSPSSDTAQSSPFYNQSGIYFDSPNAGAISGNTSDPVAALPRSQTGGVAPLPYNQLPASSPAVQSSSSLYLLIFGGLAAAAIAVFFIFKK